MQEFVKVYSQVSEEHGSLTAQTYSACVSRLLQHWNSYHRILACSRQLERLPDVYSVERDAPSLPPCKRADPQWGYFFPHCLSDLPPSFCHPTSCLSVLPYPRIPYLCLQTPDTSSWLSVEAQHQEVYLGYIPTAASQRWGHRIGPLVYSLKLSFYIKMLPIMGLKASNNLGVLKSIQP